MISGPEVARLIAEFEASSDTDEEMKPGSTKHHEEAKSTQLSFAKDVKSLISVIDDMGNRSLMKVEIFSFLTLKIYLILL